MLKGFFINKKGELWEFENSEHFSDFHARIDPPSQVRLVGDKADAMPQMSKPMSKPTQRPVLLTQEFLALKYGSNTNLVKVLDTNTINEMIALIPLADAGDPPLLEIDGDDIVLREYWGYYSDSETASLKKVLIAVSLHGNQKSCRANEAAKTLYTYLKKLVDPTSGNPETIESVSSDD